MVNPMKDDKIKTAKLKTEVLKYSTKFFTEKGFYWLLPKILSPITDPLWPDPAEQEIEPLEVEIKTYGQKYRLMHSMILHKQIAVSMGIDKLFILSPNIRIEARRPDGWHSFEFTQLDFEAENWTKHHVMDLLTEYLQRLTEHLNRQGLIDKHKKPYRYFKKGQYKYYTWQEVIDKYESDTKLLKKEEKPFFITSIPREFYDYEDPQTGLWHNYDLYIPPYGEVSSGAEREWEYEKITEKIKKGGLKPEEFKPYLSIARKGLLKPTAGAGIGMERIITVFLGADDIEKAQIFPRIPFKKTEL